MERTKISIKPAVITRVSELIGVTPLLELLELRNGNRLLLKLEQFNPTCSAKVRMARQMIDEAEAQGRLRPGGWIVESTSGNTGMGLALIAAERGYRFTAVVDHHSAPDKLRVMQALGAELTYVGEAGSAGLFTAERDRVAAHLAAENGAYWTEQHNNPANANGYARLAQELREALGDSITHWIGAVGTGGSLFGTGRVLKRFIPTLQIIGIEPVGSIIFGGPGGNYYQSGTGTMPGAEVGALVDYSLLDQGLKVSDRQAFNTARYFARQRGLLIGGSAGGVIYQALRCISQAPVNSVAVALVCDGGERYLDTIFDTQWMRTHQLLDESVDTELDAMLYGSQRAKVRA